jgi:lipid II:glycine glycyltransferase (peptidoglycan interpeptide bridge formation enzyme)
MMATGETMPLFADLRTRLDSVSRRRRALSLILERDDTLGLTGSFRSAGFVRGPGHYQPSRTVKVPLPADDEALLAQMHQKNRYSVRLAIRRGVTVERAGADAGSVDSFYALLAETAGRNKFGIHDRSYYGDFMHLFGERALMLFAMVDGHIAVGLIAARAGAEAVYMYGGSSSTYRADGAAFILQYEAMRWARDAGSTQYDLWGIPSEAEVGASDGQGKVTGATASVGEDMRGLLNFKTRFGGDIVDYPPMMERRYVPVVSWVAGRVAFDRA